MPQKEQRKKIVSFDLDMTLLDHGTWKIPDSAMEAIRRLRPEHIIVVSTGRNMDAPYSVPYRDQLQADAVIHMNGTRVAAGGEVIYERLMPKERLRALLKFAQEHSLSIGISDGRGDFYTCPDQVRQMDLSRCAVIIGSEGRGVSQRALELCSQTVKIPMRQRCESLNAAMAAAVVLWEGWRSEG